LVDGGVARGDRGAGRGLWHSVVVGELLQRIAQAGPRAVSTVEDDPAARVLPAASGDAGSLIWMDSSAGGVSTAASLQCLIRIFRDCRLDIHGCEAGSGGEGEEEMGRAGGGDVEGQAAAALLNALADKDKLVRAAAAESTQLRCLAASPAHVSAVLEGQTAGASSTVEGAMYRGQPAHSGRALHVSLRASYVGSGGALSAVPPAPAPVGVLGITGYIEREGRVCEKWLEEWCGGGARQRDASKVAVVARAAAALADGPVEGEEKAAGQRLRAQAILLSALGDALPVQAKLAGASSSSGICNGRSRRLAWKAARDAIADAASSGDGERAAGGAAGRAALRVPPRRRGSEGCCWRWSDSAERWEWARAEEAAGADGLGEEWSWEEAARVRELVDACGVLAPTGSSPEVIDTVLAAAASSDAGVRRSAVGALARILGQLHLSMPEASAVTASGSAARVGLSLGPGAQATAIGWGRAPRDAELIAALDALSSDSVWAVAVQARAVRARFGSGVDVVWGTEGKTGCRAWGHDAEGVGAASEAAVLPPRADKPNVVGFGYISKFAARPLARKPAASAYPPYRTSARYPPSYSTGLATVSSDAASGGASGGAAQQIVYPHLWSQRSPAYRAGSVAVGAREEQCEAASLKARDEIIQRPRALWASKQ
jgi:hypothetical protein